MVEGPGATRNAERARQLIAYQHEGQILDEVVSIGKEVFLLFQNREKAIRLHFGMNGSLGFQRRQGSYCNKEPVAVDLKFIRSTDGVEKSLVCYATKSSLVSINIVRVKYERLCTLDICADDVQFDSQKVVQAIRSRPSAMLSDVLLDQNIFPGAGNIIKVEGLHRARLHPKRKVENCNEEELVRVVQQCRRYAKEWLKSGRSPVRLVYNRTCCQSCNKVSIRIEKMGYDLSRTTFWCTSCQPLNGIDDTKSSGKENEPTMNKNARDWNSGSHKPPHLMTCPQHGENPVRLRRVRKESPNQGRIFVLCSKCPSYFQWADKHLTCQKCKRHRILRISKTAHSGGKWFISCNTCSSFAWAQPGDLRPFQSKLTPLL